MILCLSAFQGYGFWFPLWVWWSILVVDRVFLSGLMHWTCNRYTVTIMTVSQGETLPLSSLNSVVNVTHVSENFNGILNGVCLNVQVSLGHSSTSSKHVDFAFARFCCTWSGSFHRTVCQCINSQVYLVPLVFHLFESNPGRQFIFRWCLFSRPDSLRFGRCPNRSANETISFRHPFAHNKLLS